MCRLPRTLALAVLPALLALLALLAVQPAFAGDKPLDAKLKRLDGEKVRLSDLRGEPLLLELWATWCLPCRQQSAILEGLGDELAAAGVRAYAVNVGEDAELARQHLEQEPAAYPVLLDPHQVIARKLEIAELPGLVLLDADGRVVGTTVGVAQPDAVQAMLDHLGGPERP